MFDSKPSSIWLLQTWTKFVNLMRYKRRYQALVFCIAFNLFVFLYLFSSQPRILYSNGGVKLFDKQLSVTVLINEFEEFENDIADTVQSIVNGLPHIDIIIVAKKNPYPPLDVPQKSVKIVTSEQPANNPQSWGDPKNFIQTKYVLMVPDAVRLNHAEKLQNIFHNTDSTYRTSVTAFPVDERYHCSGLNIDLRQWTMSYLEKAENNICDAVSGQTPVVILLPTSHLSNLSEPFIRPSPEGLFIQFSLRGWKTQVYRDKVFSKGKSLFQDAHKRWKADQKREDRLLNMYKRFGIKQVNQNGVSKWYGCKKDTARCFGTVVDDMPEYIYNGRWTPPCCMCNLKETTRYVFQILVDAGVRYWLEGGSLLGAVRNHDIIPWDYDVDIGIYQDDINKCKQLQKVQASPEKRFIDEMDFVWEKAKEGEFYRVQFSQINHLHVDIFPFYEHNGIMTKNTWFKTHRQDTEFPAHFLKPRTTIDFVGIKAFVPNNYREFLELKFGKGVIENPQFPNPKKTKKKPAV